MPRWTEEARAKQRKVIMKSKPWKKATGPKTAEGKKISSQNALKHGGRTKDMDEICHFLWAQTHYRMAVMENYRKLWREQDAPTHIPENEILSGLQEFYAREQNYGDDEG